MPPARRALFAEVRSLERMMARGHTSKDYVLTRAAKRLETWQIAADEGLPAAQVLLASCYEDGVGVGRDDVEALRWHRLAAEQGLPYGQFSYGWM
ncbi:MAG TPA: hypothetical protein VKD72_28405, partial [Gemmataceae bacterium]|nr:hypothetical protein [Gemmataceae bacterium]